MKSNADAAKASADAAAKSVTDAQAIKDSIPEDYTQMSKQVSALDSGKISKFYASNQGENNLPDSDDGRIVDLKLYGRSEQKKYSGKNLLNVTLGTTTSNGVTCTANGDGTYTVNGIAPDGTNVYFNIAQKFTAKAGKKYKLVGCPAGGDMDTKFALFYRDNWRVDVGNGSTFTKAEDTTDYVSIKICAGFTANNLVFKPMIVDADVYSAATYDAYEPYVGGIPSPNPDYPQEIKGVVNPTVKVWGKNLFGFEKSAADVTDQLRATPTQRLSFTKISDNSIKCAYCGGTWSMGYIQLDGVDGTKSYKVSYKVAENTIPAYTPQITINPTQSTSEKLVLDVYGGNGTTTVSTANYFVLENIQLEVGSTATEYQPYTKTVAALPYTLNAIPVSSGGNVTIDGQEYIADYVDIERGKLVRMCKEIVFTGEEKWDMDSSGIWASDNGNSFYTGLGFQSPQGAALCNAADFIERMNTSAFRDECFTLAGSGSQIEFIRFPFTTVDDFKSYLKNNSVKAIIILNAPTEIALTADEIAAFKALASYYPATNVSCTSDELDGYTVFNYPISLANGWDYVKQQLGDTRDYIYNVDLVSAEAYVNAAYAAAITEMEV